MLSRIVGGWMLLMALVQAVPPADLVERLSAEAYPEREAAVAELRDWAVGQGTEGKKWLADQIVRAEDPELRDRALSVLRGLVLAELTAQRPGFVGVSMANVEVEVEDEGGEARYGVAVQSVTEGSPAERAGLRPGDVIISLEGEVWTVPSASDRFAGRVGALHGGDTVTLAVLRGGTGKKEEISLILAPRPWSAGTYPPSGAAAPFGMYRDLTEEEAENAAFGEWFGDFRKGLP